MTIELINGIPTRMLELHERKAEKDFYQIEEGKDYFVYASWVSADGEIGNFEVFKKTYRPKSNYDKDGDYEQIQSYPSTSDWGTIAWSFRKKKNVDKFIKKKFGK